MKVKAPSLLKKIIEALSSKTNELRIRMMIFFLLHKNFDKSSLTNSLHALVSHHHHHHHKKKNDDVLQEDEEQEQEQEQESKGQSLTMNYNKATSMHVMVNNTIHDDMSNAVEDNMPREHQVYNDDDEDHDDDDGDGDGDDGVKHPRVDMTDSIFEESKVEVEDREDIDQAADLFIQRFRKQMLLQKQRSLERENWLLLSNA